MKQIDASKFPSRAHLDAHILSLGSKRAAGCEIVGSNDHLKKLKLSGSSTVWGVPVKPNKPEKKVKVSGAKPDRGPRFESGINLPAAKRKKLKK